MIQTIDNFYLSNIEVITTQKYREDFLKSNSYYCLSNTKSINELNITLKDYQDKKYPNNTFFSFFKDEEKTDAKNQDDLIISIKKDIEG